MSSPIQRDVELLEEIDDQLADIENRLKRPDGDKLTDARGWLQGVIGRLRKHGAFETAQERPMTMMGEYAKHILSTQPGELCAVIRDLLPCAHPASAPAIRANEVLTRWLSDSNHAGEAK